MNAFVHHAKGAYWSNLFGKKVEEDRRRKKWKKTQKRMLITSMDYIAVNWKGVHFQIALNWKRCQIIILSATAYAFVQINDIKWKEVIFYPL